MNTQRIRQWVSENTIAFGAVVVAAIALAGIAGFLVTSLLSEKSEQDALEVQVQKFREIVARPTSRLAELQQELDLVRRGFPSAELTEIDVFRAFQELAFDFGLKPSSLELRQTGQVPKKKVGNSEYRVISFSLQLGGASDPVWSLLQALDQGRTPFKTLVLGEVSVTEGKKMSASIVFDIFTLPAGT